MVKRGIIDLSGGNNKIRISRRGVNVDEAGPTDFLIHENYLIAQPYYFRFVGCPFAGYTGTNFRDESVFFTLPDVGESDPIIIIYTQTAGNFNIFPHRRRSTGAVGFGSLYDFNILSVLHSPTNGEIRFIKLATSQTSPNGAYVIAYRRAN